MAAADDEGKLPGKKAPSDEDDPPQAVDTYALSFSGSGDTFTSSSEEDLKSIK